MTKTTPNNLNLITLFFFSRIVIFPFQNCKIMQKKAYFNKLWLYDPKYQDWILEDNTTNRKAKCKICLCAIELSNMGTIALDSHIKSNRHKKLCKSEPSVMQWLMKKSSDSSSTNTSTSEKVAEPVSSTSAVTSSSCSSELHTSMFTIPPSSTLDSFLHKDDVLKADILWTLKTVTSHQSFRSSKVGRGPIFCS